MFNLRISAVVAGIAFVLSLLIGLVSRAAAPVLFVRPLVFAFIFFAISAVLNFLANHFLPELLEKNGAGDDILLPGSRINITESDSPPPSVQAFLGAQADDSDDGLGNISDLVSGGSAPARASKGTRAGMDQNPQDGYNDKENPGNFSGAESSLPESEPSPEGGGAGAGSFQDGEAPGGLEGFPGSLDMLPDLDSMAGAFLPAAGDVEADTSDFSVSAPAPKPSSGSRAPAWSGDFNAKDMAAGLRTILSKEKEG